MKVSVVKETFPGERRVALVPAGATALQRLDVEVCVQRGAGTAAGYPDASYESVGASLVDDRSAAFSADIVLAVRWAGADREHLAEDLGRLRPGQTVIATCDPLGEPEQVAQVAASGARLFALEMIPRITRAQAMDVLSSMATVAGYRATLLAAVELPKMFPLLMTAAGTVTPARVFVIGAGVAGLQAIATARRLGAVVQAYDVRPAAREQCESVGARFVELPLSTQSAEGEGGYARAMDEEFYRQQRQLMADVVAESDVVITTAAIPGKKAPRLITADAVEGMPPGSVIVDLAAERGGNCDLTRANERVQVHGVTILGPTNLPSEVPFHASQMFSKNVENFLKNLIKQGEIDLDLGDEIIRETLLTCDGQVVHPRIRELLELPAIPEHSPDSNA